ncbi:hypothetical protein L1049_020828 [Liquidambar formosana]|uniref:Uncharacterized protein n=1 Tax=Liquidambar formosana TaxID=63359 RepID=A0AAP0S7Y1_LIQFO
MRIVDGDDVKHTYWVESEPGLGLSLKTPSKYQCSVDAEPRRETGKMLLNDKIINLHVSVPHRPLCFHIYLWFCYKTSLSSRLLVCCDKFGKFFKRCHILLLTIRTIHELFGCRIGGCKALYQSRAFRGN